jgi:hypothetical protein
LLYDMMNEGFGRQLGRMDKQLRRLEDRLAPPKQTEAERRHEESLMEDLKAARRRVAENRASRGLEPHPESPPFVYPPGHKLTVHDLMANINVGRDQCAAAKKKRDAEAERTKREAEGQKSGD